MDLPTTFSPAKRASLWTSLKEVKDEDDFEDNLLRDSFLDEAIAIQRTFYEQELDRPVVVCSLYRSITIFYAAEY